MVTLDRIYMVVVVSVPHVLYIRPYGGKAIVRVAGTVAVIQGNCDTKN